MRILFVCATPAEACFSRLTVTPALGRVSRLPHANHHIDLLITGVGMVATTYYLSSQLMAEEYDLAINTGICGAFDPLSVGKIMNIRQDCFADFGADDHEDFLDIFQTGLVKRDDFPFENGWLHADNKISNVILDKMPVVKGITVNKSSGNADAIYKLKEKYHADTESMEGAAFIYCCRMNNTPCMQIRSVSNYIEPRNKKAWRMEEALLSLKQATDILLAKL